MNPEDDFPWFHWSPTERRASIQRLGLVPGRLSTDKLWRPPFVCLSHDPGMAWALSGGSPYNRGRHPAYDLWQVWASTLGGYEEITDTYRDTGRTYVKEIRVYERIYKRNLWHVATRTLTDPTDGGAR